MKATFLTLLLFIMANSAIANNKYSKNIVQVRCYSANAIIYYNDVPLDDIVFYDDGYIGIKEKNQTTELMADCILKY